MKISYPNYYFDFHCIGGSCEATCCKGWKIQIDDDSLKRYKKINVCGLVLNTVQNI